MIKGESTGKDASVSTIHLSQEEVDLLRRVANLEYAHDDTRSLKRLVRRAEMSQMIEEQAMAHLQDSPEIAEAMAVEALRKQLEEAKAQWAQQEYADQQAPVIASVEVSDEYAIGVLVRELDPQIPSEEFYRLIRAISACRARIDMREAKSRYPTDAEQAPPMTPPNAPPWFQYFGGVQVAPKDAGQIMWNGGNS